MKTASSLLLLAVIALSTRAFCQGASSPLPNAPSFEITNSNGAKSPDSPEQGDTNRHALSAGGKLHYYIIGTYLNPATLTSPAFWAGLRMASPPKQYPHEWRQGATGFGRNYGDLLAEDVSFNTAHALTGIITTEDPRYVPSKSRNALARSFHALTFAFIDRSDSGHPMPAVSNFVGAAAGGFAGNAYLPSGFSNATHAGQRATILLGSTAAGNLYQEFEARIPKPVRMMFMFLAR